VGADSAEQRQVRAERNNRTEDNQVQK
jgi:hypothetical protein